MSERDFGKICIKFAEKLGPAFIERIERRIGQDFEKAVEDKPKEILIIILDDINLRFILPLEMCLDIGAYLTEVYDIKFFDLALSERYHLNIGERKGEIAKFLGSFYQMVEELDLSEMFMRSKKSWWIE